jgi:hypothetical protein
VTTTDPVPFTVAIEPFMLITLLLGTLYVNAPLLLLLTTSFKLNGSLKRDSNKFVIPVAFIVGATVNAWGADAALSRPLALPSDTTTMLVSGLVRPVSFNVTDTLVKLSAIMDTIPYLMTLLSDAFLICKS